MVTSVYYHNASSIRGKSKRFRMGVLDNDYDIIIIGETWLNNSIHSAEYFPSDYVVHRKDRYDFDTNLRGGGVLIAVKDSLPNEMVACHPSLDVIAVRVKVSNSSIVAVAIYASYGSDLDYYEKIVNFIESSVIPVLQPNDQLIIVGDFNLPDIDWTDIEDTFIPSSADARALLIVDYFASIPTTQQNRISNSRGKFLDLLFANDILQFEVSSCVDFTGCSSIYHTPILINIFHDKFKTKSLSDSFFNFRNADYVSLNEFLNNTDWNFLHHDGNLNDMVLMFNDILRSGIERHVPLVKRGKGFREPWFNLDLVHLEKRRNRLHRLYKIHGVEYYPDFDKARKEFKSMNWFLYSNYIVRIEEELTSSPKEFWNFMNARKKIAGFPSPMTYQSSVASHPSEICNLFAKFFVSVYEPVSMHSTVPLYSHSCDGFNLIKFTEQEVLDCISQIDINKSAGHDGFPPTLIKHCALSLCNPITALFNESLRRGVFPDPWKISCIQPIFKAGRRSEVSNYRGIAILSVIPKLFESMVHKVLSFHTKPLISSVQHGFYSGRSTVTNLISFCSNLFESLKLGQQLDVVYTDFAKAFDKIDHSILISKLNKLECQFIPIKWLHSYLTDRWQTVRLLGYTSQVFRVTSGVPQGSHLGPLLFSLFINDVVNCFKYTSCLLFADDMKILARVKMEADCIKLQEDLDRFCQWSIDNRLRLNVNKCSNLTFFRIRSPILHQYRLYNDIINRVEFISDLGVIFSTDATFTKHINTTIQKAYNMLGFLKRNCKDFCDPITLSSVYVCFVRPILEYASTVWSPSYHCHSKRIESVQKQFVLYALRCLPSSRTTDFVLPPYEDRCNLLNLQRLDYRRDSAAAVLVRDILDSRIDCTELLQRLNLYAPERRMRQRAGFLYIDSASTKYGLSEPILKASRIFNTMYAAFDFHLSRDSCKRNLVKFYNNR